jgi:hypothetical protein
VGSRGVPVGVAPHGRGAVGSGVVREGPAAHRGCCGPGCGDLRQPGAAPSRPVVLPNASTRHQHGLGGPRMWWTRMARDLTQPPPAGPGGVGCRTWAPRPRLVFSLHTEHSSRGCGAQRPPARRFVPHRNRMWDERPACAPVRPTPVHCSVRCGRKRRPGSRGTPAAGTARNRRATPSPWLFTGRAPACPCRF